MRFCSISSPTVACTATASGDDYLARQEGAWASLPLRRDSLPFVDLPESVTLAAGASQELSFTKGGAGGSLVVYLPHNQSSVSLTRPDDQQKVLAALEFKCGVLWSMLDALHFAYVSPGHIPPGAFVPRT